METSSLFVNLVAALAVAFLGAVVAVWLKQSLLIGYIVAGVLIGPYTPGFVADQHAVSSLADVGIVFLLFAVGLHLSLRDLLRTGPVAIIGALVQVAVILAAGYGAGLLFGWRWTESLFFCGGGALSTTTRLIKVVQKPRPTGRE
jgi:CPA2 family monovalent cation:H+ antiporter-2